MFSSANQPVRLLKLPKPRISTAGAFMSRARSARVTMTAPAPSLRSEQSNKPERRHDRPRLEVVLDRQRLPDLCRRVTGRMLAKRHRDFGKLLARRAEFVHVPLRSEGVRRYRAEIAVFGAESLAC
jgi:hypothetical protein